MSNKFWMVVKVGVVLLVVGVVVVAGVYWKQIKGLIPALSKPPGDIAQIITDHNQNVTQPGKNDTDFPLTLPDNFSIEILAKDLPGVRVMAFDGIGGLWVSQPSRGTVSNLFFQDGKLASTSVVFKGLNKPHGLAIDPQEPTTLYIAEEDAISKVKLYTEDTLHKIASLPTGGIHTTRTIEFGPDNRLYVSIGSSCNACDESDDKRAAMYVMDKDGQNFKPFATGLRNSVFFDWSYVDGAMWATENSRDMLGDDLPPDEINVIKDGGNYGWPNCYGQNIHDTEFDKKVYIKNPCELPQQIPAKVDLQAHSAPLGLGFVPEEGWPEEYWYDLIVAYHGSWNRTEPTGYKLVRIKLDAQGNYSGTEDFISGWLTKSGALGRPVDIIIQPGGTMFVSDDKAGVIYKIKYNRE